MQIGSALGPYRILRLLGSGGMGAVWLAEDTRLHRQVALKTLRPADSHDAHARARLMREARAAAALNHTHIAAVYDVLEHDEQVVLVFEYVQGETLAARMARDPLPAPEAVEVACQIAKALVDAHAHGIIHRDLKPANVIVGAGGQVKVLDFGIARLLSIGTTQTTGDGQTASGPGFIGTPGYAAPEQMVSSAVDERADLYALGVMLFEMISGRRPFPGNDAVALATKKLGEDPPSLSSTGRLVPPALSAIVDALLTRDRDHRPSSASDVLAQLRTVYGQQSTVALQRHRSGRFTGLALIGAAVLLAAMAGFGVWIWQQRSAPPPAASSPPVVAVLPLVNISGDSSRDFIAAGIAESLITSLASLPTVTVLSRASVTEARARSAEPRALARDLGATYLVEGSVQESGGRLRISINLVRADQSVAWGDNIDGPFDRVFDLQSQLAVVLTSALSVRVSPEQRRRMNAPPTSSPAALTAYWRGRALLERRDLKGNLDAATAAFSEAVKLDDRFAVAHAALGEAYWAKYVDTREPEWTRKAIEEGTTALRIDPDRAAVRYTLAITLAGTGRLDDAVGELHRALAVQPNYEDARRQLGVVLARQGKIDDAISEFRKAIALRPQGWGTWSAMGLSLFQAGRFREAVEALTKVTEFQPDSAIGYQQLGTAYQQLGEHDAALENYERSLAIRPNAQAYTNIGSIHHLRGNYQQAVDGYKKSLEMRPNSHVTWRNLGDVYRRLGRANDAIDAYRRALALIESELKIDPSNAGNLSLMALYLAKAGRHPEARRRIDEALVLAATDSNVLFRSAEVHTLAGRRREALDAIEAAIARGVVRSRIVQEDDFEALRNDPRYTALVKTP